MKMSLIFSSSLYLKKKQLDNTLNKWHFPSVKFERGLSAERCKQNRVNVPRRTMWKNEHKGVCPTCLTSSLIFSVSMLILSSFAEGNPPFNCNQQHSFKTQRTPLSHHRPIEFTTRHQDHKIFKTKRVSCYTNQADLFSHGNLHPNACPVHHVCSFWGIRTLSSF